LPVARPSKIYPDWYFWFENMSSGNPGQLSILEKVLVGGKERNLLNRKIIFVFLELLLGASSDRYNFFNEGL
jgi:hypothetical protein